MNAYIGVDLGTSAAKFILCGKDGSILASVSEEYPVLRPRAGWTEQDPAVWTAAVERGISRLLEGADRKAVKGIGVAGQMHGTPTLGKDGEVLRPCILWNDGRTEEETAYLNGAFGRDRLTRLTGNMAYAGFTLPKILWLKKHEPAVFAAISKIMLPKDYITYLFTGVFSTDYSDAAGTLLLDVKNRNWSGDMLRLTGLGESCLPRLYESFAPVGKLSEKYKKMWGLGDVTVCAGAGDNAAAAVGTGAVNDGDCTLSLGTSGTLFVARDSFSSPAGNALHSFCHANGKYHLMGCILSAASCFGWWTGVLGESDPESVQAGLEPLMGKNDVFFLPYLSGERSPHNDVNARGAFIGLSHGTDRGKMTLAVMEGVAFALRDCLEAARACGIKTDRAKLCGGGAKSPLWRKVIANALGITVEIPAAEEGPSYGAAMLAMTACGEYRNVGEACAAIVRTDGEIRPDSRVAALYDEKYGVFRKLYPALKDIY